MGDPAAGGTAMAGAPSSITSLTRHITIHGVAGVITGIIVGGLGGRLFMRIAGATAPSIAQGRSTEAGFTVGEITLGGTLGLVVFVGLFAGLIGAVFYAIARPWLSWSGPWRGVAFGVFLFAVTSATSDVLNPDNIDFAILDNAIIVVPVILLLFIAFGAMIDWLFGVLDRRVRSEAGAGAKFLFAAASALGIFVTASVFTLSLFTRELCDCDPPRVASVFVLVAAAGTALLWVSALRGRREMRAASLLGFTGLVGATAFGLVRAIADAVEIIA